MSRATGIKLQTGSGVPLFQQIVDAMIARIVGGTYPPGFRLPPSRALADELSVHRNTIVRAYEELVNSGHAESCVGRGTFVAKPTSPRPFRPQGHLIPMPWAALLSRTGSSEALGRVDRLPRAGLFAPSSGPAGAVDATDPELIDLIDLTRMQPSADLIPADELRRCIDYVLRQQGAAALGYAPREGVERLRVCIAADLARVGVPAAPEDIIVTTGSQQALDMVARALVDPGERFLVEAETYTGAINVLTTANAQLTAVPGDASGPLIAALEVLGRDAKGLYLMPNSRNPTGSSIDADRREALVAWSHQAGVPLVEDDYGADLNLGDTPPPPALRALDSDVIYVSTFSKRLIPALRVGFVVAPAALRHHLLAIKRAMDLGTSTLLQHALAEFLERGYLATHLRRTLPVYRSRRDAVQEALCRYMPESVRWQPIERGVVLWLELDAELPADAVFVQAQQHGVLVSPGMLHTVSGRPQSGIRLILCSEPAERLVEGIRRLAKAIEAVATMKPRQHRTLAGV